LIITTTKKGTIGVKHSIEVMCCASLISMFDLKVMAKLNNCYLQS